MDKNKESYPHEKIIELLQTIKSVYGRLIKDICLYANQLQKFQDYYQNYNLNRSAMIDVMKIRLEKILNIFVISLNNHLSIRTNTRGIGEHIIKPITNENGITTTIKFQNIYKKSSDVNLSDDSIGFRPKLDRAQICLPKLNCANNCVAKIKCSNVFNNMCGCINKIDNNCNCKQKLPHTECLKSNGTNIYKDFMKIQMTINVATYDNISIDTIIQNNILKGYIMTIGKLSYNILNYNSLDNTLQINNCTHDYTNYCTNNYVNNCNNINCDTIEKLYEFVDNQTSMLSDIESSLVINRNYIDRYLKKFIKEISMKENTLK